MCCVLCNSYSPIKALKDKTVSETESRWEGSLSGRREGANKNVEGEERRLEERWEERQMLGRCNSIMKPLFYPS